MANTYEFTGTGMGMTNYFVDTFVAHKMSELNKCGAPDMKPEEKKWLNQFLLNSVFRVTIADRTKAKSTFNEFCEKSRGIFLCI